VHDGTWLARLGAQEPEYLGAAHAP
jgi:hypothetical protein